MRRPTAILGILGVVLLAAAGLWLLFAPGQLVKYPNDLDKTAVAKGTATLSVDPASGAPLAKPQALPLTIHRHLKVIASSGSQATVQETSTEQLGPAKPEQLLQRYVIDRGTLKNLASDAAYAYAPDNVTNRAPAYSINLPFGTGNGPYTLWKNETASTYTFDRSGPDVQRDGLTLIPMRGRLAATPATPAYVKALGLKTQMPAATLAPQLKAAGVDLTALTPELTTADRAAVLAALAVPVKVTYLVSADTRLLIEPTTGAIVSLDGIDQTIAAAPDLARLTVLGKLLARPKYANSQVVQTTLGALQDMPSAPTRALDLKYAQTPASVADIADYTHGLRNQIRLVDTWIPAGLGLLGVLALGAAGAVYARDRKRVVV